MTIATLTSLAISFTLTPALAGNWSLFSRWRVPRPIDAFSRWFAWLRTWYLDVVLAWALRFPIVVAAGSLLLVLGAAALIPLHLIGFEFIPSVDRGQIFVQVQYPTGTPLATTDASVRALSTAFLQLPDIDRITSVSGAMQSGFGGGVNLGSNGQIVVFLLANRAIRN